MKPLSLSRSRSNDVGMNDDVDVDEVVMLRCLRKKSVTLQVKGKSSRGSQGIRSRGVTKQLQAFFSIKRGGW